MTYLVVPGRCSPARLLVQVAAVFGVEELGAALVAGRDVRRDEDVAALLGALDDGKSA